MTNRIISIIFTSLLIGAIMPAALAGGGWPQPKGHGYFKLSQWWVISDQHYTDTGLKDPNITSGIFNTSLYAEYGLTNKLTGVVYFPFFSRALINNVRSATTQELITPGDAINSLGDTDISLKYGIFAKNQLSVSLTGTLGVPLGIQGGIANNLQTGDGEWNQMLQVDAGISFPIGKINAYANAYGAFNNRTNGFSDEVRYGIEAGAPFLKDKLYVIMRLYGITSLKNGTTAGMVNSTSIFANNSEHLTFSPELNYFVNKNWGLSANAAIALRGRIIFSAPAYSAGVFFRLTPNS
ncbi:MAG: hypothetical protein AAF587_10295 [Bacteroidota bacterium]